MTQWLHIPLTFPSYLCVRAALLLLKEQQRSKFRAAYEKIPSVNWGWYSLLNKQYACAACLSLKSRVHFIKILICFSKSFLDGSFKVVSQIFMDICYCKSCWATASSVMIVSEVCKQFLHQLVSTNQKIGCKQSQSRVAEILFLMLIRLEV